MKRYLSISICFALFLSIFSPCTGGMDDSNSNSIRFSNYDPFTNWESTCKWHILWE
ncbi:hypothetical protein PAPH110629_02730 [Paenibacillus phoenicis]